MKITCSQNEILKGLQIASRAVPSRTTKAILECILIDASSNQIHLTSNDMELGIDTIVPGQIIERGMVCIDAKILLDMVRNLPNNQVEMQADEKNTVFIDCEKAHFKIPGKNGEEFPYLPAIPREKPIRISQFMLREIIRQTIFSVSDNDAKRTLTGELLEVNGNEFHLSSLDGHRISVRNINLKESYDEMSAIIPGKCLSEISKIINGSMDDFVEIFFSENHVVFEFEQTTVISRLLEGEFFNIERVVSNDYETKVSINKRELMDSLMRAVLMVDESEKKPIILDIQKQSFRMYITTFRGNFNEELFTVKEGRDIRIGFNPKFILDVLRVIDDENVNIYFISPKSPCFIKNDNGEYLYVILPVNV